RQTRGFLSVRPSRPRNRLAATLPFRAGMSTDPEKPRVLVVEDSRTVAAIVKLFLQREGFEVFVAADGVAGLEAAKRERPCVTITDVNMPGMDGPDLVRALRADDQTRDMFIFMLS